MLFTILAMKEKIGSGWFEEKVWSMLDWLYAHWIVGLGQGILGKHCRRMYRLNGSRPWIASVYPLSQILSANKGNDYKQISLI